MSALNVTPAQAFILAECLGARAQHFRSSMGFVPDELLDLIVELDVQLSTEEPPEVAQAEAAAEAAFLDDEPHEQFTHEDDKAPEAEPEAE